MKTLHLLLSLILVALHSAGAANELVREQWTVDGVVREAIISIPPEAKTKPAPLVFAFHGHGGNPTFVARSFHLHTAWPEAIVVYPQGLNTPAKLVDPDGKMPGWT